MLIVRPVSYIFAGQTLPAWTDYPVHMERITLNVCTLSWRQFCFLRSFRAETIHRYHYIEFLHFDILAFGWYLTLRLLETNVHRTHIHLQTCTKRHRPVASSTVSDMYIFYQGDLTSLKIGLKNSIHPMAVAGRELLHVQRLLSLFNFMMIRDHSKLGFSTYVIAHPDHRLGQDSRSTIFNIHLNSAGRLGHHPRQDTDPTLRYLVPTKRFMRIASQKWKNEKFVKNKSRAHPKACPTSIPAELDTTHGRIRLARRGRDRIGTWG